MSNSLTLGKYSLGIGDRFGQEAEAQLQACLLASEQGVEISPVWNKSNREHQIIGSAPAQTRVAADAAVQRLGWRQPYYVDADHIRIETVNRFIPHCDFYTIDVADWIGQPDSENSIRTFLGRHAELTGEIAIPGLERAFKVTPNEAEQIARKYLLAMREAGKVFRHIATARAGRPFITEVSIDETDSPQTPLELLVILAAIGDERIPLQTIAPKFTGRFNKGVDFVGDLGRFEEEFNADLAIIAYAVRQYGLPENLKLSIHSGSDKFSLYPIMRRALTRSGAGLHLKTAGTTWLEEIIGLAEAGGEGLAMVKTIYANSLDHFEELCLPYASVIDIERSQLPTASTVRGWDSAQFSQALRHDAQCPQFNPDLRQLLHVGYKIAANIGQPFLDLLQTCRREVSSNVTNNLFQRHILPLFINR